MDNLAAHCRCHYFLDEPLNDITSRTFLNLRFPRDCGRLPHFERPHATANNCGNKRHFRERSLYPLPGGEGLAASRPSMAATLAATFGARAEAMPAHVRSAYGKLKAFGL